MHWKNTNDRMNFLVQLRKEIPMLNDRDNLSFALEKNFFCTEFNHRTFSLVSLVLRICVSLSFSLFFSSPSICVHHHQHLFACIFLRTSMSCFPSFFHFRSKPLIERSVPFRVACVCVYCLFFVCKKKLNQTIHSNSRFFYSNVHSHF